MFASEYLKGGRESPSISVEKEEEEKKRGKLIRIYENPAPFREMTSISGREEKKKREKSSHLSISKSLPKRRRRGEELNLRLSCSGSPLQISKWGEGQYRGQSYLPNEGGKERKNLCTYEVSQRRQRRREGKEEEAFKLGAHLQGAWLRGRGKRGGTGRYLAMPTGGEDRICR